jgi:hypothetical protein
MQTLLKFYTSEDQKIHFDHYLLEIKRARSKQELAQIAQIVIEQQKAPNGGFFFAKGKSKEFWEIYRKAKEELEIYHTSREVA